MRSEVVFVFYIPKPNRYSFNALFGAAEELLKEFPVFVYNDSKHLLKAIREQRFQKAVLFISVFSSQIFEIEQLIVDLKKESDSLTIVVGGPHPTAIPEELLMLGADYVVVGEAESLFRDLILEIRTHREIKTKEKILKASSVIEIDSYNPVSFEFGMIGPLEITRGCPYRCIYCQTPRIFPGKIRHRSIQSLTSIVKKMIDRGLKDIRFISPNSLSYGSFTGLKVNIEAIETLLKTLRTLLGREGRIFFGTFPSEIRPEHVSKEAVKLIKTYCNNDNIVLGAQSGSERMLRYLKRGHSVEDVVRAVRICKEENLIANVDFIFGLPYETPEDQLKTLELIEKLIELGARVHAHYFIPLPGTPMHNTPPTALSEELQKGINRLLPDGKIFGQWQRQQALAEKLLRRYSNVFKKAT